MLAGDRSVVVAVAALAIANAAQTVAADNCVARAAAPAFEQAREKMAGLGRRRVAGPLGSALGLAVLGGIKDRALDDCHVRHFGAQPFRFGIGARDTLAGGRILDEALPVPDDLADVKAILQDAVAALLAAVDRRGIPAPAARRGDAFGIEARHDFARR
ncbi:hypothetical protein XM25_15395 [Devosia sp. H5989]|nr:hypothetical protein XM25_15395 [Devosia sp. H5989]